MLDVFAGTGTLGLESLSRGATACLFVERDRDAVRRLKQNIETLDVQDRTQVVQSDALRALWLRQLPRPFSDGVSVAFVDPPYALLREADGWARMLPLLEALGPVMLPGGVMSLRLEKTVDLGAAPGWGEPEVHGFGSQKICLYERG